MPVTSRSSEEQRPGVLSLLHLMSVVTFTILVLAGVLRWVTTESQLPELRFDYNDDHELLVQQQDPRQILHELMTAAAVDFDRLSTQVRLYVAAKRAGDLDGSLLAMRRLLTHTPDDAALHSELAQTLAAMGDLETAVVHSRKAVAIEPESEEFRRVHQAIVQAMTEAQGGNSGKKSMPTGGSR